MSLTGPIQDEKALFLVGCVTPSGRQSWLDEPNCL
jgi:hypothetical protein